MAETLLHQQPPTPPNVKVELQSGLQQLAQYNADRGFSYESSPAYGTVYGSPGPTLHDGYPQHHVESPGGGTFGLGIQYVSGTECDLTGGWLMYV
jgi:hypothetical protein